MFLDNLPIHKTAEVRETFKDHEFEVIWNVPYRPELNPIELTWGVMKRAYLVKKEQDLLKHNRFRSESCIHFAMTKVPFVMIGNQIRSCQRLLLSLEA